MSKKRRKSKPRSGYRAPTGTALTQAVEPDVKATTQVRRSRADAPPGFGFLSRGSGDSPFPPIRQALGRGFIAVGSSLPLLLGSFLSVFGLWVGLVAIGLEASPNRIVNLLALPPVSTYFDSTIGVTIFGAQKGLLAAAAFIFVRAILLSVSTSLVVQALDGRGTTVGALRRASLAFPAALGVAILNLAIIVLGSQFAPLLGPGLGLLLALGSFIAGIFFLVYAPIAVVRGGWGTVDAIRRSGRAALMPGSRHVVLCALYIFLMLAVLFPATPGGGDLSANPSVATWAYVFIVTYIHLSFLAAFAYRWMAVEDLVPDEPVRRRMTTRR